MNRAELRDMGFTYFRSMPEGNKERLMEQVCGQTLQHGSHMWSRDLADVRLYFCSGAAVIESFSREQELRYLSKSALIAHILDLESRLESAS